MRSALIVVVTAAVVFVPLTAASDEFKDFADAKNAFEAGEYPAAVERFEVLLASEPANQGLLQEIHKLLAVSYIFVDNKEKAEHHFGQLLALDPEFTLDPMVFPIDVIDVFSDVKERYSEQLDALAAAKADEEAARKKAEEEKRKAELEKLKRNVYLGRNREQRSVLVAIMPLGIGQFQNEQKLKGALFLGGEVLLAVLATTTFILHERLRPEASKPFESSSDRKSYQRLEAGYRITNQVSLITLGAVAVWGIVDSLIFFEREKISWEELEEDDVPEKLRPGAKTLSFAPFVNDNGVGIWASGSF